MMVGGPVQSVGIMSMQRIHNYGSSLQAYALRQLILGVQPRATVSFVDYEPGAPLIATASDRIAVRYGHAGRVFAKLRDYNKVDARLLDKLRFFNHKRRYASKYLPLIGVSSSPNRDFDLDLQIIGSDEVFNCVQGNTNVGYTRELFGYGSIARSVVTYAASFGNTTLRKIHTVGIGDELAANFARFAAVSVRDRSSAQIVESLTGRVPEIHLDPTLVYPLIDDPRIPAGRQHQGRYLIVYGYSGRFDTREDALVRSYADRIGARVLAFGGLQASADRFIDCDPFTLLAYFRDAEAVVTDTFHGTIFSIINEVPFVTLIRKSDGHAYGNMEKLGYLLEALGLSDRALPNGADLSALLDQPINYDAVREVRDREGGRTMAYLGRALSG